MLKVLLKLIWQTFEFFFFFQNFKSIFIDFINFISCWFLIFGLSIIFIILYLVLVIKYDDLNVL